MNEKKRYRLETSCPQCGCSAVSHLSYEEMMERYGDVPNIELECGNAWPSTRPPQVRSARNGTRSAG